MRYVNESVLKVLVWTECFPVSHFHAKLSLAQLAASFMLTTTTGMNVVSKSGLLVRDPVSMDTSCSKISLAWRIIGREYLTVNILSKNCEAAT